MAFDKVLQPRNLKISKKKSAIENGDCPFCHSNTIDGGMISTSAEQELNQDCACADCDGEYIDIYELKNVENLGS